MYLVEGEDNLVTVEAEVPANANGVIFALGGFSGGLTCYLKDGVLSYEYNLTGPTGGSCTESGGSPIGSQFGYWKFDEGAENTCSGGTNDVCNSGYGSTTLDGTSAATRYQHAIRRPALSLQRGQPSSNQGLNE